MHARTGQIAVDISHIGADRDHVSCPAQTVSLVPRFVAPRHFLAPSDAAATFGSRFLFDDAVDGDDGRQAAGQRAVGKRAGAVGVGDVRRNRSQRFRQQTGIDADAGPAGQPPQSQPVDGDLVLFDGCVGIDLAGKVKSDDMDFDAGAPKSIHQLHDDRLRAAAHPFKIA